MNTNSRILSIDIFRGLTIFLMVFVNELAAISNIPAWMKHVPAEVNGMTFVDVVFPAFLFIVGMSIPFAVSSRLKANADMFDFWKHVLIRSLGLIILGVYMVNAEEMNAEANLIPKSLWSAALYIAAILIWNRYPSKVDNSKRNLYKGLRLFGVGILIGLYFLYRKGEGEAIMGMTPSWWGILGLIGWAYLFSMLIYMLLRQKLIALITAFFLLILLVLGTTQDLMPEFGLFDFVKTQSGHLVHSLIVISGIICSGILRKGGVWEKSMQKIGYMVLSAMIIFLLAFILEDYGGISKIKATLSWALYSAGICFLLFPLIYGLLDIKGIKTWSNFLKPAGMNPLLTYILPPLFYAIVGYEFIPEVLNIGLGGIFRSLLFSLFILYLADRLTQWGIRMQL